MLGDKHFFAAAMLLALSAPAYAGGSARPISIDVAADVQQRCGLAPTGSASNSPGARIDRAEVVQFAFEIDCNTPFVIGAYSTHGALRHLGNERGGVSSDGFSLEKPYQVALSVDTDAGVLDPGVCGSRALLNASGGCAFFGRLPGEGVNSGKRIAIEREGRLTVSWSAGDGDGPRLAAGDYQDTITVVIGPRA